MYILFLTLRLWSKICVLLAMFSPIFRIVSDISQNVVKIFYYDWVKAYWVNKNAWRMLKDKWAWVLSPKFFFFLCFSVLNRSPTSLCTELRFLVGGLALSFLQSSQGFPIDRPAPSAPVQSVSKLSLNVGAVIRLGRQGWTAQSSVRVWRERSEGKNDAIIE